MKAVVSGQDNCQNEADRLNRNKLQIGKEFLQEALLRHLLTEVEWAEWEHTLNH